MDENIKENSSNEERNTISLQGVAIYCRVANEDAEAIERQKRLCMKSIEKDYCLINDKNDSVQYYYDNGFASIGKNPPDLERLLMDIKDKKINKVYVIDINRLSRNISNLFEINDLLVRTDSDIFCVNNNCYMSDIIYNRQMISELTKVIEESNLMINDEPEMEKD